MKMKNNVRYVNAIHAIVTDQMMKKKNIGKYGVTNSLNIFELSDV